MAGCPSDGSGGAPAPTTDGETPAPTATPTATAPDDTPATATDRPTATATATGTESPTATPTATPTGPLAQVAKLVPDDGDGDDRFGRAVAVESGVSLVGAPNDEAADGSGTGTAAVFERAEGEWTQVTTLRHGDARDADETFGQSVALATTGDAAIVSAPNATAADGTPVGAATVFERLDGAWHQRAILRPGDVGAADRFGSAVAVEGDVALVGDRRHDGVKTTGPFVGAVYAFERVDGEWRQEAILSPGDGDATDQFGSAVALEGDVALVGARTDDDPNGSDAGAAYVFERSDDGWHQRTKLAPGEGAKGDTFGSAVALDDDVALVGAPLHEVAGAEWAGAAYLFQRAGSDWSQQTKLTAADAGSRARFGSAVALAGRSALVGSPTVANATGTVAVFERSNGAWSQQRRLAADDGDAHDRFGSAVALSDGNATAVVGADGDEDPNEARAGAAYVFER